MSRRIVIGNVPGLGFKIRAAKPGYDAASPSLDGMLFDADYTPGRIIGSGEVRVAAGTRAGLDFSYHAASFGHGLGVSPDQILAIAQPWVGANSTDPNGTAPDDWAYIFYAPETSSSLQLGSLGNANMKFRFCSPFDFEGNNKGGPFNSGSGGYYAGGWGFTWDASSIVIYSRQQQALHIQWVALEL